MATYPEKHFGISCPSGSKFFLNPTAKIPFIGCCQEDMLTGDCPEDKLSPMSFNYSSYNDIPPQDCVAAENGAKWYVCAENQPTFIGCCDIDACGFRGCPTTLIRSARLSKNPRFARQFMGVSNVDSSTSSFSTDTATASSSVSETTSGGTSDSSIASSALSSETSTSVLGGPAASSEPHSSGKSMTSGAIGGVVVGGIAGALGLGLLFFWIFRIARKRSSPNWYPSQTESSWDAKLAGPSPASTTASQLSPLQHIAAAGGQSWPSSLPRHSTSASELPATPVAKPISGVQTAWSETSHSGVSRVASPRSH